MHRTTIAHSPICGPYVVLSPSLGRVGSPVWSIKTAAGACQDGWPHLRLTVDLGIHRRLASCLDRDFGIRIEIKIRLPQGHSSAVVSANISRLNR